MRFEQDWAVPLLILAAGILAGLITWLARMPHPPPCHLIMTLTAGRPHMVRACP